MVARQVVESGENDLSSKKVTNQGRTLRVRSELNIEHYPQIFAPTHAKISKTRTFERKQTLPDGSVSHGKVSVPYVSDVGTLRTEDIKTLTALYRLWEEAGKPTDKAVPMSRRLVASILGKKENKNSLNGIADSLDRLNSVRLKFENSFYDATEKAWITVEEGFSILSNLVIVRRKSDNPKQPVLERGAFKFNDRIIGNLLLNHSKPVYLEAVASIRGEQELLFYKFIDNVLYDKNHYQRRSKELFEDLGIMGDYPYPSDRKKQMKKWLRLEGKRMSHGSKIAYMRIEPTADGQDCKLLIGKKPLFKSYKYSMTDPHLASRVDDLLELTGDFEQRSLYEHYAMRYGFHVVDFAYGQLKEEIQIRKRNPNIPPIRSYFAYFSRIAERISEERVPLKTG